MCLSSADNPSTPQLPSATNPLVSGVYTLLSRGRLPPEHPDHPAARRRPGEPPNRDFRGVPLTAAGLRLASVYMLAHGRWVSEHMRFVAEGSERTQWHGRWGEGMLVVGTVGACHPGGRSAGRAATGWRRSRVHLTA